MQSAQIPFHISLLLGLSFMPEDFPSIWQSSSEQALPTCHPSAKAYHYVEQEGKANMTGKH